MQELLENLYDHKLLKITNKHYTTDYIFPNSHSIKFKHQNHIEYEYNGKKYIRVKSNSCFGVVLLSSNQRFTIPNYWPLFHGDYIWIQVQPIKWLVDEKSDIAIPRNILFEGIQFHSEQTYNGDFENIEIKKFMDAYFAKDIIPSNISYIDSNQEKQKIKIKY